MYPIESSLVCMSMCFYRCGGEAWYAGDVSLLTCTCCMVRLGVVGVVLDIRCREARSGGDLPLPRAEATKQRLRHHDPRSNIYILGSTIISAILYLMLGRGDAAADCGVDGGWWRADADADADADAKCR